MFTRISYVAGLVVLVGCHSEVAPIEKPNDVASTFEVAIDPSNICKVDGEATPCDHVGNELRARAPESEPEVLVCLDRKSRYEATATVMKSLETAKFLKVKFGCKSATLAGT